jgi:multiple sugar transport system permease protein
MSKGAPGNTTLTPAYLSYSAAFDDADFGQGAAIAFILLALILTMTALQRWVLRERAPPPPEEPMNAKGPAVRAQGRPVLGRFPLPLRMLGYALVVAVGLLHVLPFVIELVTGFKTDSDAAAHPLGLIPSSPTTAAFQRLFGLSKTGGGVPFLHWLGNSAFVAVLVTAGRVLFDSMAGYAPARLRFPGRTLLFGFVLGVMAVPGVALLIPKGRGGHLHHETVLRVDSPGSGGAARVDGAGVFRTYWSVVLPMARPALITLTIVLSQELFGIMTRRGSRPEAGDVDAVGVAVALGEVAQVAECGRRPVGVVADGMVEALDQLEDGPAWRYDRRR